MRRRPREPPRRATGAGRPSRRAAVSATAAASRASDRKPRARAVRISWRSVPEPLTSASVPRRTSRSAAKRAGGAVAPYRKKFDVGHHTAAQPAAARRAIPSGPAATRCTARSRGREQPERKGLVDLLGGGGGRPLGEMQGEGSGRARRLRRTRGVRRSRDRHDVHGKVVVEVGLPAVVVDDRGGASQDVLERAEQQRVVPGQHVPPREIVGEARVEIGAPRRAALV